MAKSKVVSKKSASVVAEVVQVPAAEPAPAPVEVPVVAKAEKDPAAVARATWKRRLGRWQAKAEKAGVDAKELMQEAIAA